MNPIDDILKQAVQKTVDNHLARLYTVHRPGTGHALSIIIDISQSTPDPEVSITLFHSAGYTYTVNEQLKIVITMRHDNIAN